MGDRHAARRSGPGQRRRPRRGAARPVRRPARRRSTPTRAEARPQGQRHRRVGVQGRGAPEHRAERGRRPSARGVRDGPAVVRRHADGLLRHPRPRQGHERERRARVDVLPELPAVLRSAVRPDRAEGRAARGSRSCRRTTTGTSKSWCGAYPGRFIPLVDPADVGRRADGRRGAARRRQGLPRGHVLREPRAPRLPEHPLRPLGPVLRGVPRSSAPSCACTSGRRRRW